MFSGCQKSKGIHFKIIRYFRTYHYTCMTFIIFYLLLWSEHLVNSDHSDIPLTISGWVSRKTFLHPKMPDTRQIRFIFFLKKSLFVSPINIILAVRIKCGKRIDQPNCVVSIDCLKLLKYTSDRIKTDLTYYVNYNLNCCYEFMNYLN